MRAPKFWYGEPGIRARLLSPLASLYAHQTRSRLRTAKPLRLDVPVICVGNINIGGTGKTPTVIALIDRLNARGYRPHVVTRGYGGSERGPKRVSEQNDRPDKVGDEPLLLSAFAPTWVSRDRKPGGLAAVKDGADVIILDDALQNPDLATDATIICVDARHGFGNGRIIPAGPLREPVSEGLSRGDLLLSIGADSDQITFEAEWGGLMSIPHLRAALAPLHTGFDWTGERVLAFAGIGHPEKFFHSLREIGADVVATEALDDHQPLSPALMQRLRAEASRHDARLVTTEKDAARLPMEQRREILTLPVRLQIADPAPLDALLDRVCPLQS